MTLRYGGLCKQVRVLGRINHCRNLGTGGVENPRSCRKEWTGKVRFNQGALWFVCHLLDFILKMKFKAHVGGLMNWNVCLLAFPKGEKTSKSELEGRVFALFEDIIKTHVAVRLPRVWPNCCECMWPLMPVSSQWSAWFCPLSAREGVPSPPSQSLTRTTWWNP